MWAKIGIDVNVRSMPRAQYFPKVLSFDSSAGLVGWGSTTLDAYQPLQSLVATFDNQSGAGISNIWRISNEKADEIIKTLAIAEDPQKRILLAREVLKIDKEEALHIVLLQPMFSWAMKQNVDVITRPDNRLTLEWINLH